MSTWKEVAALTREGGEGHRGRLNFLKREKVLSFYLYMFSTGYWPYLYINVMTCSSSSM